MATEADMDKQAEKIAALKKPLLKWPGLLVIGLAPMFSAFLALITHDMVIAVVLGACFCGVVGFLVSWIFYLSQRIEALTSLLLEQQDH